MPADKDVPPPPDLAGRRIGPLVIRERIAVGGFGVVFKAHDEKLGVFRAVKIAHSHKLAGPKLVEAFEAEMRTLAQLDDPTIVRILYPIEEPDLHGYVMEYVPGVTLRRLIREKKRLGLHQAVDVSIQIAAAVHHAHTLPMPVIHRDLTPENVLVRPDGAVKVTDFGIAKRMDDRSWSFTAGVTGKPRYMAPESFEGIITASCDIYALGTILYELIAGRTPFEAGSSLGYYKLHREQMVEPASRAVPDLPWKLERVLLRSLAKRSSNRYERMEEMLEQLRLFQALVRTGALSLFTPTEREVQALHQSAYASFAAGRFEAAADALRQALEMDPDSPLARDGLELCQRRTAEPAASAPGEGEISTTMRRGLLYFVKGRFREAREHFERVVERDPGHEEAQSFLAQAQMRTQAGEDALSPDRSAEECFQEGCRWLHERNYSMAVVYFDMALEVEPTHEGAKDHREIAELRMREIRAEDKRLSEKKRKVDGILGEGLRLFEAEAYSLARDKFREALSIDPMNTEAKKHRVLSEEKLYELERAQKSRGQGETAAELARLGAEAMAKREYGRAVACFEKALESRPDDAEILRQRAAARTAAEKRDQEVAFLRKRSDEAWQRGEYDEAVSFLVKLREVAPEDAEAEARLGQAQARADQRRRQREVAGRLEAVSQLFAQGLWREALAAAEEVIARDARNADAAEYKRRCEEKIAAEAGAAEEKPAAPVRAPEPVAAAAPATPAPPALPRGHSPTLVSRLREANRLERALDEAGQGKGSFLVVAGESGLGKSRLLREFVAQNSFRSTLLMSAECPQDLGSPFAAFRALVPQAFARLDAVASEASVKLLLRRGPELAKVVPELRERLYTLDLQPVLDLPDTRQVDVVRDFWLEVAQVRPVALLLERAEWLDRLSLEVVRGLLPQLRTAPLLVVGTLLADKRSETHPFPRWMVDLRRERAVVELTLGAFSQLDVEVFLRSALSWDRPDPALSREIWDLSGGNPAKVERMVGYLMEHEILTRDGTGWAVSQRASESLDLALGMTNELARKAEQVSKKHLAVLQALSMFPRAVGFKVIGQTVGVPDTQLYYLVNDLVGERMLLEQTEKGTTTYRIITEKFRDHVYRSIPEEERTRLHEKAARGMEGLLAELGDGVLEDIAAQYRLTTQADKIVEYCLKAGDRSLTRGMNREAMEQFEKAMDTLGRARNKDPQTDLLERMGLAGVRMAEGDVAVRRLQQALGAAGKRVDRQISIHRHLALAHLRHDRFGEASRALESAFNLLGRKEKAAEVDVHLLLARSALAREDLAKSEELARAVLERAKACGRRDALAEAQVLIANGAWLRGDWDGAVRLLQEAQAVLDKAELRLAGAESRLVLARIHAARYRKAEAREALEEAFEAGRAMPDPWIEAGALLGFGELAWRQGEPAAARDWLKRAERLCGTCDAPRLMARALLLLAEVDGVLGDADAARERAMDAFIRYERLGLREGMAQASRLQAEINLRTGAAERALQDARRAMDLVEKGGYGSLTAAAAATLGEALADRGEVAEAEKWIVTARDAAKRLQDSAGEARAVRAMGVALVRKRNPQQAATLFHEALKVYDRCGDKVACADGRVHYAAFLLDAGANAAARTVAGKNLKVARSVFVDAGARPVLARIDGMIERCQEGNAG